MNREKLYDLVQDCFVYDKYGKMIFNLFNFTLLFDDYSAKSVKAVFECLTDNQKEYLKNNFTNFKNLRDNLFLPSSSYISLNKLNDMITCEFKNTKMRPAKSVSDGIKSVSKQVVDNKEGENTIKKSKIFYTDEDILKLNRAYLNSGNSDMLFLQELSKIIDKCESSSDAERKAIRDLIELNAVVYSDVMLPIFYLDTISELEEIYKQMRDEFLNRLNLDYLVNFEDKFKEKIQKEFNEFIKSVQEEQKTNPNYAIQHAYEICWKEEIVYVVDNINYKNIDIKLKNKLLNINGILDIVYKEWLNKDSSEINDQLYDIITAI